MPDRWSFWIPEIPEGSNAQNRMRGSGGWHQIHRLRISSAALVGPFLQEVQAHPLYRGPFRRARIEVEFWWSDGIRRDPLNYVEGVKAIIDAMIGILIVDDNAGNLPEAIIRGRLKTGRTGIRITVSRMEDQG
jgi:hypothetical protein